MSVIDRLLCPRFFVPIVQAAFVEADHPLNTSDHFPVVVILPIRFPPPDKSPTADKHPYSYSPNWKKCDHDIVTKYADEVLANLPSTPPAWSSDTIDSTVTLITEAMVYMQHLSYQIS